MQGNYYYLKDTILPVNYLIKLETNIADID